MPIAVRERPIIFSPPMVRAILSGQKTQTRRIVRPTPQMVTDRTIEPWDGDATVLFGLLTQAGKSCPYGQSGDHLWVRETHCKIIGQSGGWIETDYRATYTHGDRLGDALGIKKRWTPSIHMPRDASRITLKIIGVRLERLTDISEKDCWAEGIEEVMYDFDYASQCNMAYRLGLCIEDAKPLYAQLWEQINGSGSWDMNPFVWVVDFQRIECNRYSN